MTVTLYTVQLPAVPAGVNLRVLVAPLGEPPIVERRDEPALPRPGLARAIGITGERWPQCQCPLHPRMTNAELIDLGGGCTPRYVCPRLAAVRREVIG